MPLRSDSATTNELLINGIGKDLSTELSNPMHRAALEHITTHLKVGKFAFNDNDEKVWARFERYPPGIEFTHFFTFTFLSRIAYGTSDAGADTSRIGTNPLVSARSACDFAAEGYTLATGRNSMPKSLEIACIQRRTASAATIESIRRRERRGAQQHINSGQHTDRNVWSCEFD